MSVATVELVDWDSRFFGLRVGKLTHVPESLAALRNAIESARRERIDCIYASVPADAIEVAWKLQEAGFIARDVRLEFARDLHSVSAVSVDVRGWVETDLPALESIAETAFTGTRFAADPGFPSETVVNLYRTWVSNSCRGYAQAVLVAGPVGAPHGFVTLHLEDGVDAARVGLIGIAAAHRSQGVGSRLIAAALGWAAGRKCREVRVATQAGNVGAQRLYQRNGFLTVSSSTWYHCWPSGDRHTGTTS